MPASAVGRWLARGLGLACVIAVVPAGAARVADGTLDDEVTRAQRAEIRHTREQARSLHAQALEVCRGRWAMNDCVREAEAAFHRRLQPLQEAEHLLDDDRRLRRAAERLRAAERRRDAAQDQGRASMRTSATEMLSPAPPAR